MSKDYEALPTRKRAPSFQQEWKVLAVLAIFVLLLEILSRFLAPILDTDRTHIYNFDNIIAEVESANDDRPKIIFAGNSLMRNGLNLETVHSSVGKQFNTAKITPVGTAITDWTYLYKRYFENQKAQPDIVILGFVNSHISDDYVLKLRRLGRHFVDQKNLPDIWKNDLNNFHDRSQVTLSHYSALIGDQPEHQLHALSFIIPHYKQGLRQNQHYVATFGKHIAELKQARDLKYGNTKEAAKEATFERLKQYIALLKKNNVEVWFMPMPQPEFYEMDQKAIDLINQSGMELVDARNIKGMTPEDFSDGYHLGDSGNEKFTAWMIQQLKNRVK